jgi:hypothetical protein
MPLGMKHNLKIERHFLQQAVIRHHSIASRLIRMEMSLHSAMLSNQYTVPTFNKQQVTTRVS